MKTDDPIGPLDHTAALRQSLVEWQTIAGEIRDLLHESTHGESSANWRPHADQLVRAVERYRQHCSDAAAQLGLWREDERDADEVYEMMWEQGDRLAKWMQRIMGT